MCSVSVLNGAAQPIIGDLPADMTFSQPVVIQTGPHIWDAYCVGGVVAQSRSFSTDIIQKFTLEEISNNRFTAILSNGATGVYTKLTNNAGSMIDRVVDGHADIVESYSVENGVATRIC